MRFAIFAVVLLGCDPTPSPAPPPSPCTTNADCEHLRGECLYPECVERRCSVRNLKDPTVDLPIDPISGLPLGKHCRE